MLRTSPLNWSRKSRLAKPKKPARLPTQMEVWKGIRKDPVPPGRTMQPKNRDLLEEDDKNEMRQWTGWRGEEYDEYEE